MRKGKPLSARKFAKNIFDTSVSDMERGRDFRILNTFIQSQTHITLVISKENFYVRNLNSGEIINQTLLGIGFFDCNCFSFFIEGLNI